MSKKLKLKLKPSYTITIAFLGLIAILYITYVVYTKKNCPTCECKVNEIN